MADETHAAQALFHEIQQGLLNRRTVLRRAVALGLSAPTIAALLAACGGGDTADGDDGGATDDPTATSSAPSSDGTATETADATEAPSESGDDGPGKRGGILRVATIGEPATLDQHQTTAGITALIGYCVYETLFTYDKSHRPIPMLAESYDVSDDGMTHTIKLRSNVPFHNGEIMTSADVIASIERWGRISGVGKNLMAATESLTAVDDTTIEWKTTEPYGTMLVVLSSNTQGPAIYPKSLLDRSTDEPLTEIIGTGPYVLAEHRPDVHIRVTRFEDYAALEGGIDGSGGRKFAYPDEILFIPVPDEASRVTGMQADDYHIAMDIGNDQYEVLKDAPNLNVEILPPRNWDVFFLNWRSPIWSDIRMRKAFQACLDHMPIMQNSRGGGDFVQLDPSLMMKPTPWYTEAGKELYNVNDPDLARQYLEEAGYDGTPIRFMCTQEYSYMYGAAVIARQQMEQVGFVVDFQVTDWATVLERRAKPEEWDIFVTGHGFVPDPSQITYVGQMNVYPGWWSDPEALELADQLLSETDFDKRYAIWEQIQQLAYETVPAVKTGDSSTISVMSKKVGGFDAVKEQSRVPYWNLWLEE